MQSLLLLSLFGSGLAAVVPSPRATLSTGTVEGYILDTPEGKQAKIFQGVPYAQPPLGDLRFSKSVPPKPWDGVLETKDWGDNCLYTILPRFRNKAGFSEDCLYVNVYAGLNCTVDNPCPVLIYAYGGANQFGSTSEYDPGLLSDFYARRGIVFVDFGYRVGTWGFWHTGTKDAPGNYVLWDMVRLLEWVQQEIGAFGGRPDQVTLWGLSSSSVDASAVALSPRSKGLMNQVLLESGSAVNANVFSDNMEASEAFAVIANCSTHAEWASGTAFAKIAACMRAADPKVLFDAQKKIDRMGLLYVTPRIDGELLTKQPFELVKNRHPLTMMIGSTSRESYMFTAGEFYGRNVSAGDLQTRCLQKLTALGYTCNLNATLSSCFLMYASRGGWDGKWLESVVALDSAFEYYAPEAAEVASMVAVNGTVYLYSFDYVKNGAGPGFPSHAQDMEYNLRRAFTPQDERDLQMKDLYSSYYANFAKFGNPTPFDGAWLPVVEADPENLNYYSIDLPKCGNRDPFHKPDAFFFLNLVPKVNAAKPKAGQDVAPAVNPRPPGYLQAQSFGMVESQWENGPTILRPQFKTSPASLIGILGGLMVVMVVVGSVLVARRRRRPSPEKARLLGDWLYEN